MKLIPFLTWSENFVISSTVGGRKFTIASKKLEKNINQKCQQKEKNNI